MVSAPCRSRVRGDGNHTANQHQYIYITFPRPIITPMEFGRCGKDIAAGAAPAPERSVSAYNHMDQEGVATTQKPEKKEFMSSPPRCVGSFSATRSTHKH